MVFCAFFIWFTSGITEAAQAPEGRIVFSPGEAKIDGGSAKVQTDGAHPSIDFGKETNGVVSWEYKPTRWGMYDIVLIYAREGDEDTSASAFEIALPGQSQVKDLSGTGGAQLYRTSNISRFYLAKAEPFTVRLRSIKESGAATTRLRSLELHPAPEGKPIVQAQDRLVLPSSNAITHSVMMRYEPATNKNCLGYWTNPKDSAEWKFTVTKPGSYSVELWQGCGKGQGGSDVLVEILGKRGRIKEVRFVVEDTGHFQNFIPRKLGQAQFDEAGEYSLWVRPERKQAAAVLDIRQIVLEPAKEASAKPENSALASLLAARRVVFLGDSITYSGEYVDLIETYLRLNYPAAKVEFINLGLPSETVSGLSEPDHAGGKFARPDLHERLGRVLAKAKPDLVFACYGMNDGIYHPFSASIFASYQEGMRRLRAAAEAIGAKVIHITPPTFDPVPLKGRTLPAGRAEYKAPYEGYNEVLDQFSEWLVQRRADGWEVIDAHAPMNQFLATARKNNPSFMLASDGVHANAQGHWLIAREVLRHLGAPERLVSQDFSVALLDLNPKGADVHNLVQQRQRVRKDAWLTHTGHSRPRMNPGKPLAAAETEAAELTAKLRLLVSANGRPATESAPEVTLLRLARFDVDATPPIGSHMAYDPVTNKWDLGLRARGVVISGADAPIVLCAIDWIGLANEGYDAFREALAAAASTTPDRVALHALHQHDAPDCDFSAEKILQEAGMEARQFESTFQRQVLNDLTSAVRKSIAFAQPITHLGLGQAPVEKVASNRRIFGPAGKVRAVRYTACPDIALRDEPEGIIDPIVSLVSFWNAETPVAVLSYYATHPQSYYRTGIANPDFPGVARFHRQLTTPSALHIHFNGAGGNIGAGKYNDGSQTNRLTLAERMSDGMRRAWQEPKREPIDIAAVSWSVERVALPPSRHLSHEALEAEVKNRDTKLTLQGNASRLAWLRRCLAGHKLDISCLKLGRARILHLPGELFVEYQLAAKAFRPDLFVAMAAYGDYGPWYIGTAAAYEEGGYETQPRSSNVGPESEPILLDAIRKLLKD